MSSRFFRGISDSETDLSDAESDIVPLRPVQPQPAYTFSDEEEETKRVLRPRKAKHNEELNGIIKLINNHKKIKDISKVLTGFENLTRAFQKAKPVIDKEDKGVTPRYYIRCLCDLEDFVNDSWNDRKALSKQNAKPLGTLKQKLRKYVKDFEADMAAYRDNPDEGDAERGSGEEEEEEASDKEEAAAPPSDAFKKEPSEADKDEVTGDLSDKGESDSDEWDSDSDESSLSSDDGKYGTDLAQKFLKKETDEGKDQKKRKTGKKDRKEKKELRKLDEEEDDGAWKKVKGGVLATERPKMFSKDEEINHENVYKKLNEVLTMRGKKRIHRSDQIDMLTELLEVTESHNLGPTLEVKILLGIVAALFEYNPKHSNCMKNETWAKCLNLSTRIIDTLVANPDIKTGENIIEEQEKFTPPNLCVHADLITLAEKLDEEFTKALQASDPHSPDYIERLKDEKFVYALIVKLQEYLEKDNRGSVSELCRAYILRIDYVYYKFDETVIKKREALKRKEMNGEISREEDKQLNDYINKETSLDVMDRLCKFVYAKDTTDRIRTQAILCHIYHHALHDNWFEARDLMLMSQLQHNISKADIPLHITYNRALVQLGLCAFRHGYIRDAHQNLLDIQIQGRAKELLAQGLLTGLIERTPEQEKLEKRRLLPFHKHINLELLECVYLVSAMLLEIPDLAANEYSVRKKVISRSFYNQLRRNEEQPLVGLPETMREHVVAASKAMRIGNWRACQDFIINDKMNTKVWKLFDRNGKVLAMLRQKIREESMRAYLFTYSRVYDCISLAILSEMFDLAHNTVHSIISKMIINEELMASLDEPTQMLIMHRTEPSRVQGLALQLADKVLNLVDQNERIWEYKQMGSFGGTHLGQGQRQGYVGRNRNDFDMQQKDGFYARGRRDRSGKHQQEHYDGDDQRQRYNRDNRRGVYNLR